MSLKTLLPEVTVAGHTVRPWSLGQIAKVSPFLSLILANAEAVGFDLAAAFQGKADELKLARVILVSMDAVVEIMAVTLRIERSDADEMDPAAALQIFKAIFQINRDHLKNSLAPDAAAGAKTSSAKKT